MLIYVLILTSYNRIRDRWHYKQPM